MNNLSSRCRNDGSCGSACHSSFAARAARRDLSTSTRPIAGRRHRPLDAHEIAPHLWADATRPTTNKPRFVLRGQLRPDRFDFESKAAIPGDAAKYLATCPIGDALLIQDYGKGVCTAGFSDPPAMMARRLAIRHGCHVVVTSGELGLWWSDGQEVRRVPAVPVQVRDV